MDIMTAMKITEKHSETCKKNLSAAEKRKDKIEVIDNIKRKIDYYSYLSNVLRKWYQIEIGLMSTDEINGLFRESVVWKVLEKTGVKLKI